VRRLLVATIIGIAAGVAAMQSKTVSGFFASIYPTDPAKREALDLCIFADPNFNRLDRAAREACYRHALGQSAPRASSAPNQVDNTGGRAAK
jgi:hypothetical protein